MMLNLAVVVLILLITLYLATQGMLSSLLALATAIFSSVLAMALLEPLQGIIGGWRPDYGRGVTFLLLFFLTFSATRILADIAVPKTIKLSLLINRIAGGFIGFFTGLVVVGTLLIGIEMLPVSRTPMGFDRFPGATHMQAVDANGVPILGELAKPHNAWFAPDRLVLAIWDGASGRSMGGGRSFGAVHPNLSIESYGYRNQVDGSLRTLPSDLMQVRDAAWLAPETKVRYPEGPTAIEYPTSGDKRLFMVRTEVSKGEKAGHTSDNYSGTESYFFISASQVRLITEKGRQYFPVGYLEQGQRFQGLSLDTGYVVDDYVKEKIVDDWVFQLPSGETPVAIEMKQLARADLTKISDKPAQLAARDYPPHGYFKDLCTLKVVFNPKPPRDLKAGHVYVLTQDIRRSDISTTHITDAHNHVIQCDKDMQNHANGWTDAGGPAVPGAGTLSYAERTGVKMLSDPDDATVEWSGFTALMMLGQAESDGARNLRQIPAYFDGSFVSMLRDARRGNMIVGQADANPQDGKAEIARISPGKHVVIFSETVAKEGADRAFFVWVKEMDFGGKGKDNTTSITLSESSGDSPIFKLDLDEKAP